MGKFLESERLRQAEFKTTSACFTESARADGYYKGRMRPFCLPLENAEENLFDQISPSALAYFSEQHIKWHDGQNGKPSNHLCSSQVCCVNFLFPFADKPKELAQLLRPMFPDIRRMLPIEDEGRFVSFEWIGKMDYLGENRRRSTRTRGANSTSADAAVMFERADRERQIVLIEWKYTESYSPISLKVARSGTDRTEIYAPLFSRDDCPLNKDLLPGFDTLFFEPFYQFMRQQFLAHEMERAMELGARTVSVLHIAPAHNTDFRRVTSSDLEPLGDSAIEIWERLVRRPDRFVHISTEQLFGALSGTDLPELRQWLWYIDARYPWVRAKPLRAG